MGDEETTHDQSQDQTQDGPAVDRDTESDPALNDTSTDWVSEGGADPSGPATDTDNSD